MSEDRRKFLLSYAHDSGFGRTEVFVAGDELPTYEQIVELERGIARRNRFHRPVITIAISEIKS